MSVCIAAIGDVHAGLDSRDTLRPHLTHLAERATMLLVAGDLTRHGDPAEARTLAGELTDLGVPVVAILGNHDYHQNREEDVRAELERVGVTVLDGDATTLDVAGVRVGIAGLKGFGGGFLGACCSEFGEPQMKAFARHSREQGTVLERLLTGLDADIRVALLHYSPIPETLVGERPEIFPFLGSYLLGEAIDRAGAELVLHGHAHHGSERGTTPGGVPVRNVAQPLIGTAYSLISVPVQRRTPAIQRLQTLQG